MQERTYKIPWLKKTLACILSSSSRCVFDPSRLRLDLFPLCDLSSSLPKHKNPWNTVLGLIGDVPIYPLEENSLFYDEFVLRSKDNSSASLVPSLRTQLDREAEVSTAGRVGHAITLIKCWQFHYWSPHTIILLLGHFFLILVLQR